MGMGKPKMIPFGVCLGLLAVIFFPIGCYPRNRIGQPVPSPFNDVLVNSPQDVDFTRVAAEQAVATVAWELRIPWSRNSLGGADRYLGVGEESIPLNGGAYAPEGVYVGPGPAIAVNDRGLARLYDQQGNSLGERPWAFGFLPDGSLLTIGGPGLATYSPDGTLLWERDPWSLIRDGLGQEQDFIPNSSQVFVSPGGTIYYSFDYRLKGQDQMLAGLLVLDGRGEVVGCETTPCGIFMRFLPGEVFFSREIGVEKGGAYREFLAHGLDFTLRRTVYVASGTVYAAGTHGTFLVRNPMRGDATDEVFTVYREGVARGLSFSLPLGHHFAGITPDGLLYSTQLAEDCLIIAAWVWPTP